MLQDWDFIDKELNTTIPQANRQKSGWNLEVIKMDAETRTGVFFDPKKKVTGTATLRECDCHDFNFSGNSPRKTFKPCMHIYRLAMELGLMETKYLDHAARRAEVGQHKRAETERLQQLGADLNEWGYWHQAIHNSGLQKNRQFRAYLIKYEEPGAISSERGSWVIHEYQVTLENCQCPDFLERRLPCKHIYAAAFDAGVALPLTFEEFRTARQKGEDIIFKYENA
jgi:hypothetical protein